ncbi:hypothetical protein [Frankia sp. ACN1ag]|uniref:hypothetical protein n=1 Tax=Frankia sp. ACN1ag TaxID=102891 RepID=UPI000B10541F|nr:hypothetical protein [Frankia sp. ACN1ag]
MPSTPAEPRTLLARWVRQQGWTVEEFRRRYAETAQAIDARADSVSERQAKRWLAGTLVHRPHPSASSVLEALCRHPIDTLLSEADPAPATPELLPRSQPPPVHQPPAFEATTAVADAEETFRFLVRAENTPAPEIIEMLWSEVRRLSRSYGDHLSLRVDDLIVARKAIFRLIDGPTEPHQIRDLYLLGGLVCAMLAHASRDLGQTRRAITYQDTALLCADRSAHPGLRIIVRTEQAATSYWMGQYAESIQFAELAGRDTERAHGSIAVLPFVQQARAYAAIGDTGRSRNALTHSYRTRDQVEPDELDDMGGLMRLSLPEQLGIIAGTAAWFPDPAESERAAHEAVTAYRQAPYADRSHNSEAIARADLATARIRLHALDGAHDALRPVLAIPEPHRVLPIREGVRRLSVVLQQDPLYRVTPEARDLAIAIDDFTSGIQPNALES